MASLKITELTAVTNTTSDDYFYLSATADGGSTYASSKIKMSDFLDDIVHTDVSDLQTDVTNLQTLTGRADGSTHMDSFTGSIITDDQDVKACLQELETYSEALWTTHSGDNVNYFTASTSADSEPTNWAFLVVDTDDGAIKVLDKTFIEVESFNIQGL